MENPLLLTGGEIAFDRIGAEHVVPGIRAILAEARAAIAGVAGSSPSGPTGASGATAAGAAGGEAARTWDDTMAPYDAALERVERAVGAVHHLLSVRDSAELRAAFEEVNPEIAEFHASLPHDEGLWRAIQAYAATAEAARLTGVRRRHLEKTVREFLRGGAALPPEAKAEVVQLEVELAQATQRFAENVLDSTNAFELIVEDEAQLAGLPASALEHARRAAEEVGRPGWRFTLHAPSYVPFMEHARERALRRRLYEAYSSRGTERERDNRPLVGRILALRRRLARTLGYADWAHYVTEERMAGTGEEALRFARDLTERTRPFYERDRAALEAEAKAAGYDRLEMWDVAWMRERIRRRRFELDPEELRPYFPLESVLAGIFEVAHRLFGVRVEPGPSAHAWHPDVRHFEVRDESGQHIGSLYADLFPRADKRSGAWMADLAMGGPRSAGFEPHLVLVAANLTPPAPDTPSLLTKEEVETLFHEFGHALHQLLSRVELPARAGTRVAWDFVELPSQIMENWTWDRDALALFARHYRTGEPIPDALLERMNRTRTFMAAYDQMRQLSFATVDLELHMHFDPDAPGADAVAFAGAVLTPFAIRPEAVNADMVAAFSHVFAGSYAAGYYSYKWAEVLEADAFTRFEREGIFNRETGRAYADSILARGDAADPMELFRDFMGREPDPSALLRRTLPADTEPEGEAASPAGDAEPDPGRRRTA